MTTFKEPLWVGLDNGIPAQNSKSGVNFVKEVDVSAGVKSRTQRVPAGAGFFEVNCISSAVPASAVAGLTVRIGTSANATLFGQINNVTNGFARGTINIFGGLTTQDVVVDVTASASAGDFNAGKVRVRLGLYTRS